MRHFLLLIVFLSLAVCLLADTPNPPEKHEAQAPSFTPREPLRQERTPVWSFAIEPTDIMTNFYDYMPGSYIGTPLQVLSNGVAGTNSCYMTFHGRETSTATRRQYMAYVSSGGSVTTSYVSQTEESEGYGICSLDPETMDPFFAYHVNFGQPDARVDLNFDMWHVLQGPGLMGTPFTVIDNQAIAGVETPFSDDSFVWPYVYVIKAPTYDTDGKRRILIFANNNTSQTEDPSENVLLVWADFDTDDINNAAINEADWNYTTFPLLDSYNAGDPNWGRYNKSIAMGEDGQMAMIGYLAADEFTDGRSRLTIFYNDNYGEGDWEVIQTEAGFTVDVPQNQDGSPYFEPEEIFFDFVNSSHPHATFDSVGRLHFLGNFVLGYLDDVGDHYLWGYYSYVKDVIWDPVSGEIIWKDVYPQSDSYDAEFPFLPWDVDQDGEVDEYDDEGNVVSVLGWPIYWYDWDEAFHENTFKLATCPGTGYMTAIWVDGLKSRYYNDAGDEDYIEWASAPEICIAVSGAWLLDGDRLNGEEWTDPIRLNSIETPELAGVIPEYVYPGSYIEDIGDGYGRLHLFYLDDNTMGSGVRGNGTVDGGVMQYCAIDILFFNAVDDNTIPAWNDYALSVSPNPFNPTTQINFELAQPGHVRAVVYNVRGQLVKTLVDGQMESGKKSLVWNGRDSHGASVGSGVYFARIEGNNGAQTTKMLMLK